LGLNGDYDLSNVVRQLTDYSEKIAGRDAIISDFRPESNYLKGRTLQLLLSAQKKTIKEVESKITRLGKGRQIVKPRFPEREEFLVLMARLFAIVASDGSIDTDYRVFYYENNKSRRKIVKLMLQQVGRVTTPIIRNRDKSEGGFKIPNIIGRLLAGLGMPIGDKVLQGVRLPDFIVYGTPVIQRAYLAELIPEEGSAAIDSDGYARIGWSRSAVLHDPTKSSRFSFVSKLPTYLVDFIERHGTPVERTYGRGTVEGTFRMMTMADLESLMDSDNPLEAKAALELDHIVRSNPSDFIEDEKRLCEANGIMTKDQNPSDIALSEQTGRVSVKWTTGTSSQEDVAVWSIVAPPNDVKKRMTLEKWMKSRSRLVKEARQKIERAKKQRLLSILKSRIRG
jgi:hypothetical protein